MKKDPSFDAYKALLETEATPLPEKLSEDAVVQMLEDAKPKQDKKKIKLFPRIAAVAAAAAIAITCVQMIPWRKTVHTTPVEPEKTETVNYTPLPASQKAAPLSQFSSDADLKAYFGNIAEQRKADDRFDAMFNSLKRKAADGAYVEDYVVADGTSAIAEESRAAANSTVGDVSAGNYGKTNTRTENVDEGDIVKNDGRYLYTAARGRFSIIDTQTMECVYQGEPKPESDDRWYNFTALYVQGDRLIVSGTLLTGAVIADDVYYGIRDYAYPYAYGAANSDSVTLVYDIADRSKPALLRAAIQDGAVESSRLVGDILYTVTTHNVDPGASKKRDLVPTVNEKEIPCDRIYVKDPKGDCTTYIVLTALDTAHPQRDVETVSLLGRSDDLYCTTDTLYVLCSNYEWDGRTETCGTEIYAFALNGGKPALKATGTVPGFVDDQYSIDQYKGFLRVTTTNYDYRKDVDVSSLYVLNKKLEMIGALKDFAPDEKVKSTRFLGDLAYVVTFRNTDPLFAVDLSDPSNPKLLGEVKLPGFSEYLHPLSDKLLLGVGYAGDEENVSFNCVKLSLFDISDPTKPKELDTHTVKDAETDVNIDPKAFVYDAERGVFGLPMSYTVYNRNGVWLGTKYVYKTFAVENGKFTDKKAYMNDDLARFYDDPFFRGTYIGEKVYTVTNCEVHEFDMASCEQLRSLIYDKELASKAQRAWDPVYEDEDEAEAEKEDMYATTSPSTAPQTIPFEADSTVAPVLIDETTTTRVSE